MAAAGEDTLEIAALGRPFQLGMLYDSRKDALVPGITLWKHEQLKNNTDVCPQHNTEFKVSTEDSIEEKCNNLKVDGHLKLSVLGGLVQLNGASKYFKDTKKSFRQERLTLHYGSTTKFAQLTMDHLGSVAHPDVLDNNTATHVVTAVLYGANAYFVFDRQVSADEKKKDVNGEVNLAFATLNGVSVGPQATLTKAHYERLPLENFNCTFYGDFKLPSNPNTFEDAMKVYTDLPNMLGVNGEHVVPLKVWLYPLVKLDPRASRLERNISTEIIRAVESVIETLNTTEMKCDDLLEDIVAKSFTTFKDRVLHFKKYCCHYKVDFMTKLGLLLPNVRGGKTDFSAVIDLLHDYEESPFKTRDLQQWIEDKEHESTTIKAVLKQLNEADIDGDIDSLLMDLEVENLVCYTFTSLREPDIILTKQEKYLRPLAKKESDNPSEPGPKHKSWLSADIKKTMKNNLCVFNKLQKNLSSHKTIFTVISKPVDNHPGSCILHYENGSDEPVCFHAPSKPDCPVVDHMTDNNVTIKLGPSCPATVETRLLYKTQQQDHWNVQHVEKNQDCITLTDLDYSTIYEIKCVAVGKLGYTVESDVIRLTVIDKDLLRNTQDVINDLREVEKKCRDLLKVTEQTALLPLQKKIQTMLQGCLEYGKDFNDKRDFLISSIRACKKEERALNSLFDLHEKSPFNINAINQWFKFKEQEFHTVCAFLNQLQKIGTKMDENLAAALSDCKINKVFSYTFTSLGQPDPLISQQESFLRRNTLEMPGTDCQWQTWINDDIRKTMREHLKTFADLIKSCNNLQTKFMVASKDHERHPGSCILLYENGSDQAVCFLPPPKQIVKDVKDLKDTVTVKMKENESAIQMSRGFAEIVLATELRLVLLGRTGSGKSAAGNTILGREKRSQAATSTLPQQSESRQGEVAGGKVTVVDTPDWFCPELSLEEVRQDVGHCVRLYAPGPHVFLLVIPVKQPAGEERGMLEKMFGERCWRNTIILFTVTDEQQKQNIEVFVQSGNQEVSRLVEKCGNRFHCLNIKESGDGSQVLELIEKIEAMVAGYMNEQGVYEVIRNMEREREEREPGIIQTIQKMQETLQKNDGFIKEFEKDLSRSLNEKDKNLIRMIKYEYEKKISMGQKILEMYEKVAGLGRSGQFIKVILPANQHAVWLSVRQEEHMIMDKGKQLIELSEFFCKVTETTLTHLLCYS